MTEFLESMGALATNVEGCTEERFYITTAISYTNGEPHIGHAYEFMSADVITRFARVLGYNTYFVTGSDEHGQKVAAAAAKANTTPLDHCNYYVDRFKEVHKRYKVSYSHFVRTTADYHLYTAQKLWKMCASAGDIYLSAYEGWYNEREEVFVSETEAEAQGFIDPGNGLPLKRVKEESYFFRMSAYEEKLLSYIECNPSFIQPEQYRNSLLARLKAEGLKDLSVSRTSFDWGVRVPEGFDEKHVMYVWFDALSNYLTGVHALDSEHELSQFWPAAMHIIGKDIVWFHGIIWPTILMSAGLPLPGIVMAAITMKVYVQFL